MTETRKLAAIMAIDVVGYSRLMGEDEAGTARAVREHREAAQPIVAGRGGRIVKTMGDGLLLEFPSVVDAVECAIAIQTLMVARNADAPETKRIVYRIGVHLGDVLIEGDDILGEGVNIAARLEGICEPGGVLISSSAHEHVRGRIDAEFVDLGEKALKNIARPVRVFALGSSASAARAAARGGRAGAPRLSLLVLPFANIGGDPEQEYFVDGVTESLTTDLSRIRGSFVIGRNTAFTYKGKAVDLKQVGRELNVRYVLEGSVQRGGQRMRVNVQLIDAESGSHLWAERFDKPVADLFDMQDEIVARLANALEAQLSAAEARRAEGVQNPDAMDLYFQGLAWMNKGVTPDNFSRARALFARALEIDPVNVEALVGRGWVDAMSGGIFGPDDRLDAVCVRRGGPDEGAFARPRQCGRPRGDGHVVQLHQPRGERHRAVRARPCAQPEPRVSALRRRAGKILSRTPRGNGSPHSRGAAAVAARHARFFLAGDRRVRQLQSGQGRGGHRLAETVDRDQSAIIPSRISFLPRLLPISAGRRKPAPPSRRL